MDEGLFAKHLKSVIRRDSEKKRILEAILEKTGIVVEESEISISKHQIMFSISSVKKAALTRKGYAPILKDLGYTLTP